MDAATVFTNLLCGTFRFLKNINEHTPFVTAKNVFESCTNEYASLNPNLLPNHAQQMMLNTDTQIESAVKQPHNPFLSNHGFG
ncbi:hypothetical protein Osc1_03030 [Hominimerdicola sp. 21CYCFAH17_S]